jgi:hypothetical protein
MVDKGRGSDKLHFRYKSIPRWTKDGKSIHVKKPAIEITLRKNSERKDQETNREIRINALIDSGADYSFLPLEIANGLRLDIDKSENKILTIAGEVSVYTSKVFVEIPRAEKLPVPVGFVNVDIMPNEVGQKFPQFVILGRKDFFEKFEVTFNEPGQLITLRDLHADQIKKTRF